MSAPPPAGMSSPLPRGSLPPGLSFWSAPALLSTWFGTGLLPKAPGTWGSLAALPVAWVLAARIGPWAVAAAGAALFLLGLWAVERYLAHAREKDPGPVVIDEVAAQLLAVAPAGLDPLGFALGFVLFRIFDILKPWPLKRLETLRPDALGVMADDLGAAFYTSLCLAVFFIINERINVLF